MPSSGVPVPVPFIVSAPATTIGAPSYPWSPLIITALASGVVAACTTLALVGRGSIQGSRAPHKLRNRQQQECHPDSEWLDVQPPASGSGSRKPPADPSTPSHGPRPVAQQRAPSGLQNAGSSTGLPPNCSPINYTKRRDPYDPSPRDGSLSWDDYFMALAFLSAERSKDPNKQVGAVIVNHDNVILGIGYNGFPRGCCDRKLPWAKAAVLPNGQPDPLSTKYPYVVHAEANALLNKNLANIQGARVYVTMFPCNECAKLLIQAGVREVVYHEAKVNHISNTPAAVADTSGGGVPAASAADANTRHTQPDQRRSTAPAGQVPAAAATNETPRHVPKRARSSSREARATADEPGSPLAPSPSPTALGANATGQKASDTLCATELQQATWPGFPTPAAAAAAAAAISNECEDDSSIAFGFARAAAATPPLGTGVVASSSPTSAQLLSSWANGTSGGAGGAINITQAPAVRGAAAPDASASSSGQDVCYLASLKLLTLAGVQLRQHQLLRTLVIPGPSALD